jgi:hypothetical protein
MTAPFVSTAAQDIHVSSGHARQWSDRLKELLPNDGQQPRLCYWPPALSPVQSQEILLPFVRVRDRRKITGE